MFFLIILLYKIVNNYKIVSNYKNVNNVKNGTKIFHENSRNNYDPKEFPTFEKTWKEFFTKNKFLEIHYDKDNEFLKYFVKILPKEIWVKK